MEKFMNKASLLKIPGRNLIRFACVDMEIV